MQFSVHTLLKEGDRFNPIDQIQTFAGDPDYIDGAICLQIGDQILLSEREWDLVDQLWEYMINGLIELKSAGKFRSYFPDQPLEISFERNNDRSTFVQIGDEMFKVPTQLLVESIQTGSREFFNRMKVLIPATSAVWDEILEKVETLSG